MTDPVSVFLEALAAAGIPCTSPILSDGQIHRYKAGEDKEANSWYVFHQNGGDFAAGAYGCWKRQLSEKWHSVTTKELTPEERATRAKLWRESQAQHAAELAKRHEAAALRAASMLEESETDPKLVATHPYLSKKKVRAYGELSLYSDLLQLALRDSTGKLHSLQHIDAEGSKRYLSGGRIRGCYFALADRPDGPLVICEGYATGATIHEATGYATVCAMDCGNLRSTYDALRAKHPGRLIILAADNDRFTPGNPGLTKAKEIKTATKDALIDLCIPLFDEFSQSGTDFNDLSVQDGLPMVRSCIRAGHHHKLTSLSMISPSPPDDPNELIKNRFLCRGGIALVAAPSGIGKSSFILQLAMTFATGRSLLGIKPAKPLKILVVQAENDEGDLSEMRDGILEGLQFTPAEHYRMDQNVILHSTNGERGAAFASLLSELLSFESPDLIVIDPILAYIDGLINDQEAVTIFMRSQILPVLAQHSCAAILVHHTNKPMTGKEKANWSHDDFKYLGAGSAEFTNAARAVLSIQSTGTPRLYRLHGAKRGERIGWQDEHGELSFSILIKHSSQGICWQLADPSELPPEEQAPSSIGRPPVDHWPTFSSIWHGEPLTASQIRSKLLNDLDLSETSSRRVFSKFIASGHIILVPGSNPETFKKAQ